MRNFIDFAVIQPMVDGAKYGGPVMPCRITTLGNEAKAVQWDPATIEEVPAGFDAEGQPRVKVRPREPGFVDYDHLTDITYVEDERHNRVVITGISDRLVQEQGLVGEEARIEWQIDIRGCQGCN